METTRGPITSHHDYEVSRIIDMEQHPFYALVMATMRRADTDNASRLRLAFPRVWDELAERYNARGGLLESERAGIDAALGSVEGVDR